jgi:DNA mismatch repair protein MutL
MPKIRILDSRVINMIAAGEVVDRPSSVIKELVENSIDAGASSITVETKGDGRELIKVTDDGVGMSEEDAALAFERHATSKIATAEDLESIRTMGFRGEALAAIASVAEVELVTRAADDEAATRVVARGGQIVDRGKVARSVGTTIKVTGLFYNAPARAKFMKSKATEVRHAVRTFATHAMSHYWIAMRLVRDRRVILSLPAVGSIEERVGSILGRAFGEDSIALSVTDEHVQLCGFLSRPEEARTSSGYISIFVNNRPVDSRLIVRAVCDAYGNTLMRNRYPTGVILVTIDPAEADFNVHPTKREVRFRREREVRGLVVRAVESALTSRKMIPPLLPHPPAGLGRAAGRPIRPISLFDKGKILVSEARSAYRVATARVGEAPAQGAAEASARVVPIVQIKNSYILAESDQEFYLIDQHAAHERILYEEVRQHLEGSEPVMQELLFPETVEVTPEEEDVIDEHFDKFRQMGFDLRKFGRRTYVLEAVPAAFKQGDKKRVLAEMVDEVIENRRESHDIYHLLAAAFACKAAIKAGDRLNEEETRSLVDRLFASRMPLACPHGRPTMIRLSWDEIERRFLRK